MENRETKITIGWRETVSLPDLGLENFRAKMDSGALTTALHATNISTLEIGEEQWVEFLPDHDGLERPDFVALPVLHTRRITNTSGVSENRFIVATRLQIGGRSDRIELSLTNRSDMKYPIIIGRSALRILGLCIDPSRSWLQSRKSL